MEAGSVKGDLTQGKVWKIIPAFVFPLLIGNLLQQMYNLVDSVIVGHFLGKEALAAVSASFFIYYFIISLVIGVGSGITVVISQFYGAKQYDKVQLAFSSIFIFTILIGIFLSVIGVVFSESFFRLTKTPEDVIPGAVRYFRVYIGGAFIFITLNSLLSVFRGMGDSTRPMIFVLITALLNVTLDVLFIIVFKWDIEGVAFATILAQMVGVVVSLVYLHKRHPLLSLKRKDMKFERTLFVRGMKIGLPTSIQQCSLSIGLLTLLGVVNIFGTDTLTAYGAAGKIDSLVTQVILTLSSAISAFCGQNMGAGSVSRVHKGVRFAMLINILFSSVIFSLICFFGREMMMIFTSDETVISIGYDYLRIVGAVFMLHGAMNVMNGAMRGAGDTLFAMVTGIVSFWLIRIPLAYFLSERLGYCGIWWAISINITLGFLATSVYYLSGRWKRRLVV
ncbi:MAG: MATE family efflux transporter [Tannerella sp.]|jgi:putative MATE family efflux protein|nr:MATE family efflux transporter [Tannerella sp.]